MWSSFIGRQAAAKNLNLFWRYSITIFVMESVAFAYFLPHHIWWDYMRDFGYTMATQIIIIASVIVGAYRFAKKVSSGPERLLPLHVQTVAISYLLTVAALAVHMGVHRGQVPIAQGAVLWIAILALIVGELALVFMLRYQLTKQQVEVQKELADIQEK